MISGLMLRIINSVFLCCSQGSDFLEVAKSHTGCPRLPTTQSCQQSTTTGNFYLSGNGYISTDVLKEILQELDSKLTNEDLDNIIEEVDEDGSGTLDFDEFMEMMAG